MNKNSKKYFYISLIMVEIYIVEDYKVQCKILLNIKIKKHKS